MNSSLKAVAPAAAFTGSSQHAGSEPKATFSEVFARYAGYVPTLLRRLGVANADVPDLAQDVFTLVYQKLPEFRGESTVKTWLCGIALRVASNHRRTSWVRRAVFHVEPERVVPADAYERLELHDRIAALERALARLSAAQRAVFVLFEVEELDMREVAKILGCSEKTAYTRLYAARKHIARRLGTSGTACASPDVEP
jgi:RNA polymerase sigma-70 factor (ECF subfamily)